MENLTFTPSLHADPYWSTVCVLMAREPLDHAHGYFKVLDSNEETKISMAVFEGQCQGGGGRHRGASVTQYLFPGGTVVSSPPHVC
ncbi:hypothetical protein Hamer_G004975 [Homarus americanus]|uniref:Uncharacterized protein n=1 Tax=Homarus americanus TaxID=6706 RepID=A0A8J5JY60_HOMAM|nr:hypothetical protein Hamer_G004975 [Homarus americanus]